MGRSPSYHGVLILASLADDSRHGYAIRKDVAARTDGSIRLGTTTLYRLLGQLLDDGLIAEAPRRAARDHDDERRRYYRITPAGRRALDDQVRELERVLMAARPAAGPRPR